MRSGEARLIAAVVVLAVACAESSIDHESTSTTSTEPTTPISEPGLGVGTVDVIGEFDGQQIERLTQVVEQTTWTIYRYSESETLIGMSALKHGSLLMDEESGCAFFVQGHLRLPTIWPSGTRVALNGQGLLMDDGTLIEQGVALEAGGGAGTNSAISDRCPPEPKSSDVAALVSINSD